MKIILPPTTWRLAALLLIPVGVALAQPLPAENFGKKSFDELKIALAGNPATPHVINALRTKGDKRAIPILKDALSKVEGKEPRQEIAIALIELGDKDDIGWPILEGYAREAIETDMPLPIVLDDKGEIVRGAKSPAFMNWCADRHIDPNKAYLQYVYGSQGDIKFLGRSDDKRAIPLLMTAVESKNPWLAILAAQALARLQHKKAIGPLIEIAGRSRPDIASAFGEALVFFDDPKAQVAAEKFIKNKHTLELRRKQAKERGPKGLLREF